MLPNHFLICLKIYNLYTMILEKIHLMFKSMSAQIYSIVSSDTTWGGIEVYSEYTCTTREM